MPLLLAAACASSPQAVRAPQAVQHKEMVGDRAAHYATTMLGKRYHYRGASPAEGFDCSGLVQFSFRKAGAAVPRSTEQQRLASRPVPLTELRRGDLLFFDQEGKKYGHVAIYLGYGKFVHAPSSGKAVRSDWLDSPYWRKHFTGARRLAA